MVNKLTDLIGHTPMLEVCGLPGQQARLALKLEYFNPGGSVKDRVALSMIEDAERRGKLKPGATIIEPTSGNTGVGLAWVGAVKHYRVILTMPDNMSVERRNLLSAYGAELELTPGADGMKGAISRAEQLQKEIPNAIILGQFTNPANPAAHVRTTGEEIWTDTNGEVDIFVAGIGTGGTLSGVGEALKSHKPSVSIIGVEPASSPVLTTGKAGKHKIQGIGAGFVPATYHAEFVDSVMTVREEEAYAATRRLAKEQGLLVGISSGAAFHVAYSLACKPDNKGKLVVALLPDTGERYLSVL